MKLPGKQVGFFGRVCEKNTVHLRKDGPGRKGNSKCQGRGPYKIYLLRRLPGRDPGVAFVPGGPFQFRGDEFQIVLGFLVAACGG